MLRRHEEVLLTVMPSRRPWVLWRHEEATIWRELGTIGMCEAARGRREGAVVFHCLLLPERLENKGDESIHSSLMQAKGEATEEVVLGKYNTK